MDPDDTLDGLRGQVQDQIAAAAVDLGQPEQPAPAPATPDFSNLPPAAPPGGNDCEFTFIGGAGTGGPYLNGFKTAFDKAGIQNVKAPNQGGAPSDPSSNAPIYRVAGDVVSVPMINDLNFAKSLVDSPAMKAAAEHSRSLGDEQYNLGGYSYGAAGAAANAYAIAQNGGKVDNLVLVGAPINKDLYEAVKSHPNIRNVITMDLGAHGDPIHAGMTDPEFVAALPKLASQLFSNSGHFYYSGAGPEGDARRAALARTLAQKGVR